MDLVGDRDRLLDWAERKGDDGIVEYHAHEERDEHRRPARATATSSSPVSSPIASRASRAHGARSASTSLLLSVGADLPYLTGYEAMPLERLTMLVLPASRRRRSSSSPRLEAPRVDAAARPVRDRAVGRDRRSDRARRRHGRRRAARAAIGDHDLGRGSCSTSSARCRRASFVRASTRRCARSGWSRTPTRSRRCAPRAHAVDEIAADMRARPFAGRTELDVHRELVERMLELGHERVELRDRRARPSTRRARTTSRRPSVASRDGRHRAVRLRRHDERLLLRHHAHVPRRRTRRPRCATPTRCSPHAQEAGVRAGDGRHTVRRGRRRGPARSSPPPVSASGSCTASVTASAPRRTRTRTWSRATATRSSPATRSASSPASTSPAASACGSRTSWSRPTRDRERLNDADRGLAVVG